MLIPTKKTPSLNLPSVGGNTWNLDQQQPKRFTLLLFYRGLHCPICKAQLNEAQDKLEDFANLGVDIVAVSMDDKERAEKSKEEWGLSRLKLLYDLPEAKAREWGLYLSQAREGSEEPPRFSEPGQFLIDKEGKTFYVATQSMPFARPGLDDLISGLKFIIDKAYPARGTLS